MKKLLPLLLVFFFACNQANQPTPSSQIASTCESRGCNGSDNCTACKNCTGCKYCAKQGGTCGVCEAPTKKTTKTKKKK